jgi:hypothetical protein
MCCSLFQRTPFLINISGNGFSYTEIRFLLNGGYAQLNEEIIYALIRLNKYNTEKKMYLVKKIVYPQINATIQ